ncbi:methylglyoxal synthase [Hamadaea flava]|uniref:Methylglyoxal synthase n=1 Tax=Hamadaea flava TaxID=1742688 RepID=A0ABV8LZA7_9ACTN|nr:methylglyoxal synthase [Hamadaea flava]MCP2321696.1 methylglyoxal synthase [Hamadaea flava]
MTRGIALVAHDRHKQDLIEFAQHHREVLRGHRLYSTGTTGRLLIRHADLPVTCLRSGPHGGDHQLGAQIVDGDVDLLIFFWDPLTAQPHEPDVRPLQRLATLANIPMAYNRASADYIISSPLLAPPSLVAL